ncbi:ThiF family adenylyltransferase [Lentzea sp. BCCO 10_0856]|uniref:ThiF family adenylyltransferase n=1 Tax=Lentzea miocenica TaxID=3095431 RepID=A0ABU4TFH5_9PSEU|nr:ThiF family adenylyltransferase [Lentzea sp. BCCO 10_0856]MDX8036935.1 ThiF family adenylyltransferase [Lentzea sp. BCCO 10_0856]
MIRRNRGRSSYTKSQQAGLRELRQVVAEHRSLLKVVEILPPARDGSLLIRIRMTTSELTLRPGGMPVSREHEELIMRFGRGFPLIPPDVWVDHDRFVGHAHVLEGRRLCVYLDASREWHPDVGVRGFLNQLWIWFDNAASGAFDATDAMYHPVGGVLHQTPGTPMIVARQRFVPGGRRMLHASLSARTPHRLDLVDWKLVRGAGHVVLVVVLDNHLVYGAGRTVPEVLEAIACTAHVHADTIATALAQAAARNKPDTPQYLIIAAPERRRADHRYHLISGRVPAKLADQFRSEVGEHGPLISNLLSRIPTDDQMEWCMISDERPEVVTRRDATRPMAAFQDLSVEIWGCGGLGSWIAEFVARAGAQRITLRDKGEITGGLLVRQNYVENDIGANKAERLADRLRLISDDLVVTAHGSLVPYGMDLIYPDCDVLIDATVSNTVATYLDSVVRSVTDTDQPLICQVATDNASATRGLMIVRTPGSPRTLTELDTAAGSWVAQRNDLQEYWTFWRDPAPGEELVPTRGCSVPTFHGSATDLAATAATLLNLLARHIGTTDSGTHLIRLPHTEGTAPGHAYLAM